jgi:hypothetical protein
MSRKAPGGWAGERGPAPNRQSPFLSGAFRASIVHSGNRRSASVREVDSRSVSAQGQSFVERAAQELCLLVV